MSANTPRKPVARPPRRQTTPAPGKTGNKLTQPQSRWQRVARYGWDRNRGRG
jgi:hypothetical protein